MCRIPGRKRKKFLPQNVDHGPMCRPVCSWACTHNTRAHTHIHTCAVFGASQNINVRFIIKRMRAFISDSERKLS